MMAFWRILFLLLAFSATPATAHLSLTDSDPANGAELVSTPDAVVLYFSRPARLTAASIAKTDADAAPLPLAPADNAPTTEMRLELPALADGTYRIVWSAIAEDTHLASGEIVFNLTLPVVDETPDEAVASIEPQPGGAAPVADVGQAPDSTRQRLAPTEITPPKPSSRAKTPPDLLAVAVRALGFAAVLQAVGAAIFLSVFGAKLASAQPAIRRLTAIAAVFGVLLTGLVYLLEPARMAGDFAGAFDPAMHSLLAETSAAKARAFRIFALILVFWGAISAPPSGRTRMLLGAAFAVASFGLIGHISSSEPGWLLFIVLAAHLSIAAFWFGALIPLLTVLADESRSVAAAIVDGFSQIALWLVPVVFVAGAVMAFFLIGSLNDLLTTGYGRLILTKTTLFAILMGLAGLNKFRFGPALSRGEDRGLAGLKTAIRIEFWLILAVLTATAFLTTLFSPEV